MRTIAIANQKGGVGKTTLSLLLADAAMRAGQRVLLVDLDPQANATHGCGAEMDGGATLADVLLGPRLGPLAEAVRPSAWGFDVAVASTDLAGKERNRRTADEYDLRSLIGDAEGYDVVLLDCPPSLGVLTVNALAAADACLIVTDPSAFALAGSVALQETVEVVRTYFNPHLGVAGVVINLTDATVECRVRIGELQRHWGRRVLEPHLPRRVIVKETISRGQSLWTYGSDKGADEIRSLVTALCDEAMGRNGR